jgi:hypothetical protein
MTWVGAWVPDDAGAADRAAAIARSDERSNWRKRSALNRGVNMHDGEAQRSSSRPAMQQTATQHSAAEASAADALPLWAARNRLRQPYCSGGRIVVNLPGREAWSSGEWRGAPIRSRPIEMAMRSRKVPAAPPTCAPQLHPQRSTPTAAAAPQTLMTQMSTQMLNADSVSIRRGEAILRKRHVMRQNIRRPP